jgi:Flp pilus assembly protein TadG
MVNLAQRLWGSTDGAVAPVVALSLVALIAAGGIAFDYARMASLDSELQDAADQAALAAAGQLDGQAGACARAAAAASNLVNNNTLFANEAGGTRGIVVDNEATCDAAGKIRFYKSYDQATDTPGDEATTDAEAKVVIVDVNPREAIFALTPIVAAVRSGNLNAEAVASLGSAICKVPPVMICNPAEPAGNTNVNYAFNPATYVGDGLKLVSVGNSGSTAWAPGDFGYLNTGSSTSNPNVELRQALGWSGAPGDCSPLSGVQTRTGAGTPVTQALNTRFDIYEKANTGNGNAASCPSGGSCPPSINTVKDLVRKADPANGGKCGITNNEWELPAIPYLPTSGTADLDLTNPATVPTAMGYPRDKCHAVSNVGVCTNGKIGDGAWDRNAYFYVNYGWTAAQWPTFLASGVTSARIPAGTAPTRYQVYLWEIANRNTVIGGKTILGTRSFGSPPNAGKDYDAPVCSPLQTPATSGIVPGGGNVDRRRISAAVVNCTANNVHGGGATVYPVAKWIELFLVEPSVTRSPPGGGGTYTDQNDVYVEVIGETVSGGAGATAAQVVRHDVPYLIK